MKNICSASCTDYLPLVIWTLCHTSIYIPKVIYSLVFSSQFYFHSTLFVRRFSVSLYLYQMITDFIFFIKYASYKGIVQIFWYFFFFDEREERGYPVFWWAQEGLPCQPKSPFDGECVSHLDDNWSLLALVIAPQLFFLLFVNQFSRRKSWNLIRSM